LFSFLENEKTVPQSQLLRRQQLQNKKEDPGFEKKVYYQKNTVYSVPSIGFIYWSLAWNQTLSALQSIKENKSKKSNIPIRYFSQEPELKLQGFKDKILTRSVVSTKFFKRIPVPFHSLVKFCTGTGSVQHYKNFSKNEKV